MKKTVYAFLIGFVGMLVLPSTSRAQAVYTATRSSRLQAGVGGTLISPDYTELYIKGISVWGDYDFTSHFGVEAEGNFGSIITPQDVKEVTYFVGPRFALRRDKLTFYAKIMFGHATISNTLYNTTSSYTAYEAGGGVEYLIRPRFNLRFNVNEQKWTNFQPHTLSPVLYTVGVSYVIR
jgi:hypothetical protein